jgi:tripartite-type tricarboxylate transporter receptor subunit TctC
MIHRIRGLLLALCFAAGATNAQEWPSRPVRIINTFGAGTTTDTVARVIAEDLQRRLGQPFVVVSKPGAGGMIGAAEVARAEPDGYTIGVSNPGPLSTNQLLYKSMAYEPFADLAPITLAAHQPCALVVNKELPITTAPQLLSALKRDPSEYRYAQIGSGGLSNLLMAMLAARADVELVSVAYNGSSEAALAVMRGDVQTACLPAVSVMKQAEAGRLRIIGVSTTGRAELLPDVPTLQEQGLDGFSGSAWIGIVAPARTPPALIARINKEISTALRRPEAIEVLRRQLMEVVATTPEEFDTFRRGEAAKWKPIVDRYRITMD